jgi:hypothetical protein
MQRKFSFIERLDRTLSGGFLKQIKWLLGFLLVVLTILICISLIFPAGDEIYGIHGKLGRIKGVMYHLIDPGNSTN